MSLISVTRLRVRSWLYLPAFFVQANRSAKQAAAAPGNLAVRLLADRRFAFWTMTAWPNEAAMKAFMQGSPHGPVMRKLMDWCDEAAIVHWTQENASLPGWDQAHQRMQQEGRRSKVHHPSAAYTAFVIPAPVTTHGRDRRMK